jgi:MoxR-like ATPase
MNDDIRELFDRDGYTVITLESDSGASSPSDYAEKEELPVNKLKGKGFEKASGYLEKPVLGEKVPDKDAEIIPLRAPAAHEYDIPTIVEYLNWHMNRISENVIGRNEIVKQAFFAILTGEHMLLLSRTGMAKSYLANYIFNTFDGARIFASQASKDQTPDNYFGPYNIEEFKKGKIKHNIKGSIIESNFVFLDEFFDASDVVLRSLLSVLNERKFVNGQEQIDASVHTAIATANYMRLNEVTEAVLDRFTYKSIIPEDNNLYSQLLIDQTYEMSGGIPVEPEKKIFFEQIQYMNDIIRNRNRDVLVVIPEYIYFLKNAVVNRFVSEMRRYDSGFFVSPRKIAKLSDFLRASALTNNRFKVTIDDIREMYLVLCTLNSYISVKSMDKSEVDLYQEAYQQTMIHFDSTGAGVQIELLLNIRKIFQELRENPEKRELILEKKGLIYDIKEILRKIFPSKKKAEDDITLASLKRSVDEIIPAVEEVKELKLGILKDYVDLI